MKISSDVRSALDRFLECCEDPDAGGHDVSDDMMKQLTRIGLVRSIGFGRHETTEFGDWIRAQPPSGEPVVCAPVAYANCQELKNLQDCNHQRLGLDSPACWPLGPGESKPFPWLVPLFDGPPTALQAPVSPSLYAAVGAVVNALSPAGKFVEGPTHLKPELLRGLCEAYTAAPTPDTLNDLIDLRRYAANRHGGVDCSEQGGLYLITDVLALFQPKPEGALK